MRKQILTTNTNLDLTNIDRVPSSGTHSGSNATLCVFEDNEAVIKMIIKGRSPTMRHVSRTHRVALVFFCLTGLILILKFRFDTLIPNINSQTFLTKGNLTRDEWKNLLHLFHISHVSSTCCATNFSLVSCPKTMAKRIQEQKGEERSVATSKCTATNLSSHDPTSSSSAKSPIASKGPGILIAVGKPESTMRRNSNPKQRRVLTCG